MRSTCRIERRVFVGWALPAALALCRVLERLRSKSFRPPAEGESLSLACPRESDQREGHPAWRLPPVDGRQIREPGPGFSSGHRATAPALPPLRHPCRRLSGRKGVDIHVDSRCAACRPRLTAAQGTPGRAAGHPGPHFLEEPRRAGRPSRHACQKRPALRSLSRPQGRPAGDSIRYRHDRPGMSALDPKRTSTRMAA
jgi:hypothetical protein